MSQPSFECLVERLWRQMQSWVWQHCLFFHWCWSRTVGTTVTHHWVKPSMPRRHQIDMMWVDRDVDIKSCGVLWQLWRPCNEKWWQHRCQSRRECINNFTCQRIKEIGSNAGINFTIDGFVATHNATHQDIVDQVRIFSAFLFLPRKNHWILTLSNICSQIVLFTDRRDYDYDDCHRRENHNYNLWPSAQTL